MTLVPLPDRLSKGLTRLELVSLVPVEVGDPQWASLYIHEPRRGCLWTVVRPLAGKLVADATTCAPACPKLNGWPAVHPSPESRGLFLIGRIANFVAAGSLAVGLSRLLLAGTAAGIIWFAMLRRFAVAGAGRW